MRYKDEIQCNGHQLVQAVREEARAVSPQFGGEYYALHIRRGDFQFKVRRLNTYYVYGCVFYSFRQNISFA
jgi:hypothetical protein